MAKTPLEIIAETLQDLFRMWSGGGSVYAKTNVMNSDNVVINPSTTEKQDIGNTSLNNIEANQTDGTAKVQNKLFIKVYKWYNRIKSPYKNDLVRRFRSITIKTYDNGKQ